MTLVLASILAAVQAPEGPVERRLYVAERSGLAVYDISNGHQEIRRIPVPDSSDYEGLCVDARGRL